MRIHKKNAHRRIFHGVDDVSPISSARLSARNQPPAAREGFTSVKSRSDSTCRLEYVEAPPLSRLLPVVLRQLHLFQVLSVRSLVLDLAHVRLETKRIIVSLKPHHRDGLLRLRNVACIIAQDNYNAHTRRIRSNCRKHILASWNFCR